MVKSIHTLGLLIFTLVFFTLSCATTKKSSSNSEDVSTVESNATSPVRITVPRRNARTYFSSISSDIMALAEEGSPKSIRSAISLLRKADRNYSEQEKVLLVVLDSIMKIVWPSEKVEWDVPSLEINTPYTGAIESARQGIYDLSTGNVDFFTILLPSLVLVFENDVSRYAASAEQALQVSLSMRNDSVLALYLLALLYQKTGQHNAALEYLERAEELSPACSELVYEHGKCLLQLGYYTVALRKAESLLQLNQSIVALKLCVEASFALEDYDMAEEYVSRVLQQEPNNLEYVLFRARILAKKGDYIRSASLLDVYSRHDTLALEYLLLRADIQYTWSKNVSAAITTIETAVQYYPQNKDVLLMAAKLSSETGALIGGKTSEDLADEVLLLIPDNIDAQRYKIAGLARNSMWLQAYTVSKNLVAKTNLQDDILKHIAICLEANYMEEAWNLISPLYRENQHEENIVQLYIRTLYRTGRTAQALSLINFLLPNASSSMKSFLYYQRSFLQDNQDTILADLRSSLISNARNSDALFRMYQIYYERRDYRRAQYYLKQVVALEPNNVSMRRLNDELTELLR
ncbi:MAG: hypothetical protein IJR49_01435 [Treponema sp.]|nr:hypothetical protein [Treponema sp.]